MRTRSLAPKTRCGRARNVMLLKAPAPAVVLAAVLRKSRRVTSDSDGMCHLGKKEPQGGFFSLSLRGELPVRLGHSRLWRASVMDEHAVAQDQGASCWNRIR